MVGLVIVTHSRALSQALADLVRQVAAGGIPLAAVGGVGDDGEAFGTDAAAIAEAIGSVYSADGVVVLMDLGSAVLSAETALELIPGAMRPGVRLCAAPVVEGAVAAGVQIGLGSDLSTVCREAARALTPKIRHLGGPDPQADEAAALSPAGEAAPAAPPREITLTVNARHGLHVRPAARFVRTAAAFDARVRVKKAGSPLDPVPAASLNSLAALGVRRGERIVVSAAGEDAPEALQALADLVNHGLQAFDVEPPPPPGSGSEAAGGGEGLEGVALSEGVALGPVFHQRAAAPQGPREPAASPEGEWARLLQARESACAAIEGRRRAVEAAAGAPSAAIFDAHLLILRDPVLLENVRKGILDNGENAAWAWQQALEHLAGTFRALPDAYMRQRGEDVADVGLQVLRHLLDPAPAAAGGPPHPAVLVARELTPGDVAALDGQGVLGIVTVAGGPTSHSAILARALGIPAVAGVDPAILDAAQGTTLGLDGFSGTVWIDPLPEVAARLEARRAQWLRRRDGLRASGRLPAVTLDGRRMAVAANIGSLAEAGKAGECGADGVGLLRTEFLFLKRRHAPSEAEQVETLVRIARAVGDRPICVRTLDAGGDKPLPYLPLPAEGNPCLGMRAVRLCLRHPEIFRPQMRAILRAGADGDLRLMFPMISRVEEVDRLLAIRDAIHRELADEAHAHRWPIPTGIMVETPAAALLAASLAERLDFFSIGTNDLTQYTLAAERGNADLFDYADPLHPAVLRLIAQVVAEAHRRGKPVTVCGEMAADPAAAAALVGLGVDELSMAPDAIPAVKALIRGLALEAAAALAGKMLAADTAGAARGMANAFLGTRAGNGEQPSRHHASPELICEQGIKN